MRYVCALTYDEDPDYTLLRNIMADGLCLLNLEILAQPSQLDWLVSVPNKFRHVIGVGLSPFALDDNERPLLANR